MFRGRYHVLGGTLSALDGIGPRSWASTGCCAGSQRAGHRRGDPGAQRHRRRPDHRHYLAERLQPPGVHRHPARPRRAGRRRAQLSRRGHARRRARGAPAGRLTGGSCQRATSRRFARLGTSRCSMALLEILRGPASRLKTPGRAGRADRRRLLRLLDDMLRPCTRRRASGSRRRRSGVPKRAVRGRSRRRGRARADVRGQSRDRLALGRATTAEEGCLSLPEQFAEVARPQVRVRYLDREGASAGDRGRRPARPLPAARDRPSRRHPVRRPPVRAQAQHDHAQARQGQAARARAPEDRARRLGKRPRPAYHRAHGLGNRESHAGRRRSSSASGVHGHGGFAVPSLRALAAGRRAWSPSTRSRRGRPAAAQGAATPVHDAAIGSA